MNENSPNTTELLARWQAGEEFAKERLLEHCCERLRRLARRMLRRSFEHVGRWEETDDVLQRAILRLHKSLDHVRPESSRHFYNLAGTQIRRELIDLARHYYGPEGRGANHETDVVQDSRQNALQHDRVDWTGEPASLAEWTEFHQTVEALPDTEREVVELHWYQGLTYLEAAKIMNINERTVRRYWATARTRLRNVFGR